MALAFYVAATALAVPGLAVAAHLTILTVASLTYRERLPGTAASPIRFLVLIPAHNEESVLDATLEAVEAARRASDTVLVVADRCTDRTVDIARAHGARVLERAISCAPGRAAARQDGLEAAKSLTWDALVAIDADSRVQPEFLDVCERALQPGVDALQVRGEATSGSGVMTQASVAAFALQGVTVPRGRDRLGCSVRLRGTGMVVRRNVFDRFTFRGPGASEDMWFSLDLCCAGIRTRHVDATRLHSESARSLRVASNQRLRWEVGRLLAAREFVRPLLRRHDRAALEMVVHLLTPPLSVALISLLAGLTVALVGHAVVVAIIAGTALVLLGADVIVGLIQARVGWRTWISLLVAPWYVPWKGWVQLRAVVRAIRAPQAEFPATIRE